MARPTSARQIVHGLEERVFKPLAVPMSQLESIDLTLDGLEAMRLADIEGLYHEEAAARMGISRATFARVLAGARAAVAEALVSGKAIHVGGGAIAQRADKKWPCPVHGRGRRRGRGCRCRRGRS